MRADVDLRVARLATVEALEGKRTQSAEGGERAISRGLRPLGTAIDASVPTVNAYLRQTDGETVLVVANLADAPADGVALTLETGPLCGSPTPETLLGPTGVHAPAITATGGLDGYVPLDRLGARQAAVIRLAP